MSNLVGQESPSRKLITIKTLETWLYLSKAGLPIRGDWEQHANYYLELKSKVPLHGEQGRIQEMQLKRAREMIEEIKLLR